MIESMWAGGQQPVTDEPKIVLQNQRLVATSRTPGASIACKGVSGRRPVCANWSLAAAYRAGLMAAGESVNPDRSQSRSLRLCRKCCHQFLGELNRLACKRDSEPA